MSSKRGSKAAKETLDYSDVDSIEDDIETPYEASDEDMEGAYEEIADAITEALLHDVSLNELDHGIGVRAVLTKDSFSQLSKFEKLTGLSRSECVDIAVQTLATLPKDFILNLIEAQMKARLAEIAKGL